MMNHSEAKELAAKIATEHYASRGTPIPGTLLKIGMLKDVQCRGESFDEKAFGFSSFLQFVTDAGLVVERRPGTDFVVLPREATEVSGPRINPEFWRAFVSFPVPETRRVFKRETRRIIYEPEAIPVASSDVLINPISPEQQVQWRHEFVSRTTETDNSQLVQALASGNPLREFSLVVRREPTWAKRWNKFVYEKVSQVVLDWATGNDIPTDQIFAPLNWEPKKDSERQQLYLLLDRIPLDNLLDIAVPLRWFVEPRSK